MLCSVGAVEFMLGLSGGYVESLKQYQVDSSTDKVFGGNPAAVVPLSSWPDDSLLQAIAEENNISETAFFVSSEKGYKLQWFTPVREVDLCGHATLEIAHVKMRSNRSLHSLGPSKACPLA